MSKAGVSLAELSTLRALTYRLSATSTSQLPQQVPAITASLANCRTLLASNHSSTSKSSSEASIAIHKYRTFLSTLLQDRTIQGRWVAIVLVKATIEIGGWETLQKSLPWVRGLLGILTKPDSPSSKKLCLITLTRIFVLTKEYPTLVREITTPSLPTYIQSCLQIISSRCPAGLLKAVLGSFTHLLPRHPTIFRSYTKRLHQLLGRIIAPTPSSKLSQEQVHGPRLDTSSETSAAARRLYTQLPCCVPKGASNEEWEKAMKEAIVHAHYVADKVFRAVIEDWQPSNRPAPPVNGLALEDEVQDLDQNSMDLTSWVGIFAGGERLIGILQLVQEYLANPTSSAVTLQVGLILELVNRILSLTIPSSAGPSTLSNGVRANNQVSKTERENLWMILPHLHVTTLSLLRTILGRCDDCAPALAAVFLDQIIWIFASEKDDGHIRAACYSVMAPLLTRCGLALPKSTIDSIDILIRTCCDDVLLPRTASLSIKPIPAQSKANGVNQQQVSTNADAFLNSRLAVKDVSCDYSGLQQAAHDLLPIFCTSIRQQYLSDSLRARIDRAAILTQDKDAMIASVLNPLPNKKFGKPAVSIMPILARSFPEEKAVESLLRPRMSVLRTGVREGSRAGDIGEVGVEIEEAQGDNKHFVGEELNTLLESAPHADQTGDHLITEVLDGGDAYSHSLLPAASPPVANGPKVDIITQDAEQNSSGIKRPQEDDIPLSPTKRVKAAIREETQPAEPAAIPTSITTNLSDHSEAPPVIFILPQAAQSPQQLTREELAKATATEDNSDDNDDFGELVLGQDTDEESDS